MKKSYIQVRKWYNENLKTYLESGDVLMKDKLDKFLNYIPKGGKILDMGSGTGRDVRYFIDHGYKAIGIDNSKSMINFARKQNKGTFHLMDMSRLNLISRSFNGVWASSSIFTHLTTDDIAKSLSEVSRVLKESGVFAIIAMKKRRSDVEMKNYVFNKFSRKEINRLLDQAGFRSVDEIVFTAHGRKWFYMIARKLN